jgi:hypothetical protein
MVGRGGASIWNWELPNCPSLGPSLRDDAAAEHASPPRYVTNKKARPQAAS